MNLNKTLDFINNNSTNAVENLIKLLSIPSISTDKNYKKNCMDAASWINKELTEIGFESSINVTNGHPIVLATFGSKKPHLLFYGHYDVQPVDPLNLWVGDPFKPELRHTEQNGTTICARGASDDKGQLMTFIEACRAIIASNSELPCKITILLEGEEECGSPSLVPFLKNNYAKLQADYALICDTGMWNKDTPAISTMLRGMMGEEICVTGPNKDLHSGMYGGPTTNPISVVGDVISKMHDTQGKVQIPKFYSGVEAVPKNLRLQWESLDFSETEFLQKIGLTIAAGESEYTVLEKLWARPTCELNGIWGGYTGIGFKTVIPAKAHAKFSFRLVGEQNPNEVRTEFRKFVQDIVPADCKVEFFATEGSRAITVSLKSKAISLASKALKDEWGIAPVYAGCGGSIPVVSLFKDILNLEALLIGFALDDDLIHSPNEKYNMKSFVKGTKSWARILHEMEDQVL